MAKSNGNVVTQMHFARQGEITPRMRQAAERDGIEPELVRQEVAAGRMVVPANINHKSLEPIAIGRAAAIKNNANIGNAAVTSEIDGELAKLHLAVRFGADTSTDLRTGGDIDATRTSITAASPPPIVSTGIIAFFIA